MTISRSIRTVSHLKPSQVFWQAWHRVASAAENPSRFSSKGAPGFPGCRWEPLASFLPPGVQADDSTNLSGGKITFLNLPKNTGWPPDWRNGDMPLLWQYNLHYFEWLWAFSGGSFDLSKRAVLDWIENYSLKKGHRGWDAYPVSLRLINWCAFFFGEHRELTESDPVLEKRLWESIWLQTEWIYGHIEYHILGNHIMENAAALSMVGACFGGKDAVKWREKGLELLEEQVKEQVLDDGYHFELSPMYHSRIFYLMLTLFNTGDVRIQSIIENILESMAFALSKTTHPDGQIALLNDSALGIYNTPRELFEFGIKTGALDKIPEAVSGAWSLSSAGYYGYTGADGFSIICDAGNLGPDYIPGHAHADMLSFEMSIKGYRVIVDSGVYNYECGGARRYCRSTRAHNTVEIDGRDQAEMWSVFRVGRRGHVEDVRWEQSAGGFELSARHNGYRHLSGGSEHTRCFALTDGQFLRITDTVAAKKEVECRSYLHLHPDCRCEIKNNNEVLVTYPAGKFIARFFGQGKLKCVESTYHPEFYLALKNVTLVYSWIANTQRQKTGCLIDSLI